MRSANLRRVRCPREWLWLSLLLAWPAPVDAQLGMDLSRPPRQEHSVEVRSTLPAWVAVPLQARILSSDGLELRALRNSAVTYENARLGVLVGALRNHGGCARQLTARLQYTDDRWRPVGRPLENEARVSQVEPDGLLPYRFRLRRTDEFEAAPSGYIVQVTEADKPVAPTLQWVSPGRIVDRAPCPPASLVTSVRATKRRATLRGYRVDGSLTVLSGGPVRPDAVMLTALLLDEAGEVLEVLAGVPGAGKSQSASPIENAHSVAFRLSTGIPLGKVVKTVQIFTELLPGAQVAAPQPAR